MRLQGCHRWLGRKTNNEAEYLALIDGLKVIAEWNPDRLEVFLDSKLVVEQINGKYKVKKAKLQPLHAQAKALLDTFHEVVVSHVEREKNRGADALVNIALDEHAMKAKAGG